MLTEEMDIETQIYLLSLEIKYLVDKFNINKSVVLEGFESVIMSEMKITKHKDKK